MKYHAWMKGEDGLDFTVEVEANSISEAREQLEEDYPESRVDLIFDPKEREERLYREANARYENPDLDDYDY